MQRLIDRGLLQAGLVHLGTPELVGRYNECLTALGIPPTKRDQIHIDGIGWSPEVAEEHEERFYLCHGLANPLAVIVSPEQYKKPVYFPVFSWERGLMRLIFETYHREITDITATHSISFDLENCLTRIKSPLDLLLLAEITADPDTNGISGASEMQKRLIADFLEGINCLKKGYPYKTLVDHALQFGDLRRRSLSLQPVTFNLFNDFYTVAFNGAAVLRKVGERDILVLEDDSTYQAVDLRHSGDADIYYLHNPSHDLITHLARENWLVLPEEEYRKNSNLLEDKREQLLAQLVLDLDPGLAWNQLRPAQRKQLVGRYDGQIPEIYFELEKAIAMLRRNGRLPKLSDELWQFLAVPAEHLHPSTKEVLWMLLTRRDPRNLLELYTYDKNYFLTLYLAWPESKREWGATYLAVRYKPRMLKP